MVRRILSAVIIFLVSQNAFSQAPLPDAAVIVYESTLNGFLNAVGPLSGKGQFNTLGIKEDYTWTLRNARIEISKDQASFLADANVKAGLFSYSAPAMGAVEVKYFPDSNRIKIKVVQAVFEVYIKILGKKIHIANIDAAKFYRPEFEFAGPRPVQPSVNVTLPDGGTKTIYITPVSQNLKLEEQKIVVTSQLVFSDQPPPNSH
ncbi:MAG: hypothetical protein WAO19_11990 [Candidatus Kryptoniota bacterium]